MKGYIGAAFRIISSKYRVIISKVKIKLHLYHKVKLPIYNHNLLEERHHYIDPNCVSDDYHFESDKPTVDFSLIVPLYNSAKFIDRIVRMLAGQETSYLYEVLLIDDGSKDDTYFMIQKLIKRDSRFRCFSKPNGGISSARNYAIDRSNGKYIGFMDHDDIVDKHYIQKLVESAESQKADIVRCYHANVFNGKIIKSGVSGGFVWGGVYHRRLFEHVRFPENYWYEDMITGFLLLPQSRKTYELKETLYYKESHAENASKTVWNAANYKCIEDWYLIQSLSNSYFKLGLDDKEFLFKHILKECGELLVSRISKIDLDCQMQIFQEIYQLLGSLYDTSYSLNKQQLKLLETINNLDFEGWRLVAISS